MHRWRTTVSKFLRLVAVAAAVAAASFAAVSAPANATTALTNFNWAGYYAETNAPITTATVGFQVPANVSCENSRPTNYKSYFQAGMWVGIGGIHKGIDSGWLEQAGVMVKCTSLHATPVFTPFWEYVKPGCSTAQESPCRVRKFGVTFSPGEYVTAEVESPAVSPVKGQWYFRVTAAFNGGQLHIYTRHLAIQGPATTVHTAEAITERPITGLVDLGTVRYTAALYYTAQSEEARAIPVHPVDAVNEPSTDLVMSPGAPYSPDPGAPKDSFNTYYASHWLSAA
jgi:hypothetical protein